MTVTVPLSSQEEAKLATLAASLGVSPDKVVTDADKSIIWADRSNQVERLFAAFDSSVPQDGVRDEAFHRENWY